MKKWIYWNKLICLFHTDEKILEQASRMRSKKIEERLLAIGKTRNLPKQQTKELTCYMELVKLNLILSV
jgi:hypothetical protein